MTVTDKFIKKTLLTPGHSTYGAEEWAIVLHRMLIAVDRGLPAIMFMSFRLADNETRFPAADREMLGVVRPLAECRWNVSPSPHPGLLYCDRSKVLPNAAWPQASLGTHRRPRVRTPQKSVWIVPKGGAQLRVGSKE